MKGLLQWLTDPAKGTPVVAGATALVTTVLVGLLGVEQPAVDGCLAVGRAVGRVLFGL